MPAVTVRPQALADLAEIFAYISEGSPDHAEAFANRIHDKFQLLAHRPGVGRRRPELAPDMRSLTVGRYVVFYVPRSRGIEVVRVLHGSRDIESLFEDKE